MKLRLVLIIVLSLIAQMGFASPQSIFIPHPTPHTLIDYALKYAGRPPEVRSVYFLPTDRPYRPEMVQRMKDEIRNVQRLFANWMEAHGYGRKTFRIETDDRGDPVVHRLNGKHRESYYKHDTAILDEVHEQFDFRSNLYFIVPDIEVLRRSDTGQPIGGSGGRHGKYGGYATAKINFGTKLVAHELGHAFGLEWHDFSNDAYIMSYGNQQNSLSACHAEFLAVNPYFNISTAELSTPRIERLSPLSYPVDSKHFSIKLKVNDPEGLHQLLVIVQTIAPHEAVGQSEFKACRSLSGKKETIIDFEYDGIIPSSEFSSLFFPVVHPISIYVVDIDGNVAHLYFELVSDQSFAEMNKTPVDLPDRNLRTAIKSSLNETWGDQIFGESLTRGDMTRLVYLDGRASNISNLTGLEYATNLRAVDLGAIRIEDIGWVENNSISDLSPLRGLTGLTRLALRGNNITDLSPLAGLTNLKRLDLRGNNISDLSPLSRLTNLATLALQDNRIFDLSPLADLTNLTELELNRNSISNLSPLAGLTNLATLLLQSNSSSNLSPLAGLTNLKRLGVASNNISDLSPLAGLTNLATLGLSYNNISDISPLTGLTNLTKVVLRSNRISDLSSLVANMGLGNGGTVKVKGNPLSYQSIHTHIPALQSREVTVEFTPRTLAPPLVISGDNQQGAPGAALEGPFVVEIQDRTGTPFAGVPVVFTIAEGNGTLSITSTGTDANGRAESTLTLGSNPGTNTVEVSVEGISQPVVFSAEAALPPPVPTTLSIVSGDNQNGLTGEVLANPFAVKVRDQYDAPMEGVTVTLAVSAGGGTPSPEMTTTDANGQAESTLTLGPNPGTNTVEVSVEGISQTVVFSVEAALPPSVPTTLSIVSGDNQNGLTGEVLANPFVVKVRDQYDAPMEGVTVTLAVSAGGGTPSPEMTTTDANGQAESTLTLGSNPGTNTVEVSVEGISQTVVFSAEAALPPPVPTTLSIVSGDNQNGLTGEVLANPFVVKVRDQYDAPMEGVTVTLAVSAGGGTPSPEMTTTDANGQAESTLTLGPNPGTNTVEVSVEGITEMVTFNAIAKLLDFDLSVPADISLIHVPLKVTAVAGVSKTLTSVADLYDALGGATAVNSLITYDYTTQRWHSYSSDRRRGTPDDQVLTDDRGIIAVMKQPVTIRLGGKPLGTNRSSTITLHQGINLVGVPLKDSKLTRVSDLLMLDGIRGNVSAITVSDGGAFKVVTTSGQPGAIPITGGQSFIMRARQAATVTISGQGWANVSGTAAAAPLALRGIEVGDTTPVLGVSGSIADEESGLQVDGFRVTVKNLSTGRAVTVVKMPDEVGYQLTVVDIETGRAATIGDTLEISAQSPDPFIGVQPMQYTVTTEDVKQSWIQLPALVAYEIPAETELLTNYPNPFNPETWIPYRLAEDAFVTLTIYDTEGRGIRTLDVGHRIAAAYESRLKAIYWDGRNQVGEQVASGVYFYHLSAGDYSATRKMLILK